MSNNGEIDFDLPTGSGGNEWYVKPLTNHSANLLEAILGEKKRFVYEGTELLLFPITFFALADLLKSSRKQPPYFETYNAPYGKTLTAFPVYSKRKPDYQQKSKEPPKPAISK